MPGQRRPASGKSLVVRGARQNNLKNIDVEIPLEQFVCVTGASGSGKSSLIHEIVQKRLYSLLHDSRVFAGEHDELTGSEHISDVIDIDQSPIGRSSRSNPATYIGFYDAIRTLFAETDEAKQRGFTASTFSFNVKGGRCEECSRRRARSRRSSRSCPTWKSSARPARARATTRTRSRSSTRARTSPRSSTCRSRRASRSSRTSRRSPARSASSTSSASATSSSATRRRSSPAAKPSASSSPASSASSNAASTTCTSSTSRRRACTSPTSIGCCESLNRLVDTGHSVVVIEHNLDVIKTADHVIDLGPEGGHNGGQLIACGTPEEIAACKASHTGKALAPLL